MRDLILLLIMAGLVPFILARPTTGVLVWSWLGYMNPHRLTWGFAYDFPFVMVAAVLTLVAMPFSKQPKRMPWSPLTVIWLLWVVWMCLTTLLALNQVDSVPEWERTMKIQLMVLATLLLMGEREHIHRLVWVIALSLGFFGVKGGIFTVLTGGNYLVLGPPGSHIAGNNEIALALLTVLPLIRYLQITSDNVWIKRAMLACMVLCAASILGTWSRGALLGGAAMLFVLWLKTRSKWLSGAAIVVALVAFLAFLPEGWFERMSTIKDYREDQSALGRLNAWGFAINLANDRPLVGGGFRAFTPELFQKYAPTPDDFHDAHSIYFEVLGEQGYVGLTLFLALAWTAFRTCARIRRKIRNRQDLAWAGELASMVQVSLVGFAVGGAFLGLAYFDLPYSLVAIVVLTNAYVDRALAGQTVTQPNALARVAAPPSAVTLPRDGAR
ncbi:MAG TPA: putative O-glycosylation ligase, exosortase A system-associated [Steroidobacteraceae bacterium]|nr:putative O-glycosylation ligase, exosortase A system-associated [Steroidobacteraceae bacterium]